MNTPKEKLTEEQIKDAAFAEDIESKASELEKEHKCKVHPIIFQASKDSEKIVGYIKEPARIVKMRALNKGEIDKMGAGADILECTLIKEASDARIYSEASENDAIYIGACVAALKRIDVMMDVYKKK